MIATRLTKRFKLKHPILSAPMALASGGALAAAVTDAGGLGFIGGGYGDTDWTLQAFDDAGAARVGCGFITRKVAQNPDLLARVLKNAFTDRWHGDLDGLILARLPAGEIIGQMATEAKALLAGGWRGDADGS